MQGRVHVILAALITLYISPIFAEDIDWKKGKLAHLAATIGTYHYDPVLDDAHVKAELERLMPPDAIAALHENLQVAGPIDFIDGYLVLSGNRPHYGGEDTASVWVKIYDGDVLVVLQRQGKVTLYSRPQEFQYLPQSLRARLVLMLEEIPWRAPPEGVTWVR